MRRQTFDEVAQGLLRDGQSNGGLTIKSLFDLIVASHNDASTAAASIAQELKETRSEDHIALERIVHGVNEECEKTGQRLDQIEGIVNGLECVKNPRAPRRSSDTMEVNYSDTNFQSKFMWLVGGKIAYVLIAVIVTVLVTVINVLLKMVWFGTP